jgi:hypothetical protein
MTAFAWRFHFELGDLGKPLIALGIDLDNRRMSGQNEVLLESLEANIQSRDQTYSLKCHSRHTASSQNVRSKVC